MLQNIIFVLIVASNLVIFTLKKGAREYFWSLYGFLFWCIAIIGLGIFKWGLASVAVAVLWIHGLLKYRPVLKKVVAEPYVGSETKTFMPTIIDIKPKIDPDNIQGSFYGLSGYTSNPYERLETQKN